MGLGERLFKKDARLEETGFLFNIPDYCLRRYKEEG